MLLVLIVIKIVCIFNEMVEIVFIIEEDEVWKY